DLGYLAWMPALRLSQLPAGELRIARSSRSWVWWRTPRTGLHFLPELLEHLLTMLQEMPEGSSSRLVRPMTVTCGPRRPRGCRGPGLPPRCGGATRRYGPRPARRAP